MTTLETCRTFVPKKLVQIQGKVFWYQFKEVDKSVRLDDEVLANKNKVDKDNVNKNKAESHRIVGLMTLIL